MFVQVDIGTVKKRKSQLEKFKLVFHVVAFVTVCQGNKFKNSENQSFYLGEQRPTRVKKCAI